MKKLGKTISTILVAIPVMVALSMVVSMIAGCKVFTVMSGSMEPAIHTGSLIYVKPADADELRSGDIITYSIADNMTATHRIVEILRDEKTDALSFVTKGDANDQADAAPVRSENVIGRPVVIIPVLGYAVSYIRTPPWLYLTIAVVVLLLILSIMPVFIKDNRA